MGISTALALDVNVIRAANSTNVKERAVLLSEFRVLSALNKGENSLENKRVQALVKLGAQPYEIFKLA